MPPLKELAKDRRDSPRGTGYVRDVELLSPSD